MKRKVSRRVQYDGQGKPMKAVIGPHRMPGKIGTRNVQLRIVAGADFTEPTAAATVAALLDELHLEASSHPRLEAIDSYAGQVLHKVTIAKAMLADQKPNQERLSLLVYSLGVYVERMRRELPARKGGKERSLFDHDDKAEYVSLVTAEYEKCGKWELAFRRVRKREGWTFSFRTFGNYKKAVRQ